MGRGESLLRLFLAGFAALLSFLLVFGLAGLAITYYVVEALERGQAPIFLVVEEVSGRKTARVDIFPAFFVSLAISPVLGYAYYEVLTASLSGAPLKKEGNDSGSALPTARAGSCSHRSSILQLHMPENVLERRSTLVRLPSTEMPV